MPSPTTIASVTFAKDLRLSVLQALSIDRLYDLEGLAKYLVVLNDADNAALEQEFRGLLRGRISETLTAKMRFLTPADLPRGGDGRGWHGQQAIKLALADVVQTDTYLLLDAKNHFIRPSTLSDFFLGEAPSTVFTNTSPNWAKYVRASLEALDAHTDERAARMMPTTTPYLMLTDEVEQLIKRLESKYSKPLLQAMRATGWGTEFFLYYAHLVSAHPENPYVNGPKTTRTLFTQWPEDPAMVLSVIDEAGARNVPMFGLHRNRLPQLTDVQRGAIRDLWSKHLLAPWEDPDWFMAY